MITGLVNYKSSQIAWARFGNGPEPVLCFHGYGEDAQRFASLRPATGERFTLLAIDLPFHGRTQWREGLRLLAREPNVWVKISGLVMLDHHWTPDSLKPYVFETLDAFGTGRAMFASNFPVDKLNASYAGLWHAFEAMVADLPADDQAKLFRRNAESFYRI